MTRQEIQTQIDRLNSSQKAALRTKFGGRTISSLNVNDDFVTVEFDGRAVHSFFIGKRGGIRHHIFSAARG